MTTVNVYLSFDGNCEVAFNFYKSVFGGEFTYLGRYSEMPASPEYSISEADKNKIMHVGLPISKETILMGADFCAFDPSTKFIAGNNFSICITPADEAEGHKLFNALSVGGNVIMPFEKQFWGSLNGMLVDKFGITWMVDYELKQ